MTVLLMGKVNAFLDSAGLQLEPLPTWLKQRIRPLRTAPHSNGYLNGEINMALTAQEIFSETVQSLPPDEQFRLAALILQELSQSGITVVDSRDTWSEQDQKDLTTASLKYAKTLYPEEEDLV